MTTRLVQPPTRPGYPVAGRLHRAAVVAAFLAATASSSALGQGPKIVPPRPCEAPPGGIATLTVSDRSARDRRVRVAVVRFEESVTDDARLHLTWAVGEHVAEALRGAPGLTVESPGTVARAWMESGAQVENVARSLDADFVVMGRSAMRGDQAEITVALWHAAAKTTRWDRTFVYPALSLRAIEDSVVANLVSFLGVRTDVKRDTPEMSAVAYEAIARGDYFMHRPGTAAADSARAAYARAASADTRSAVAKARLARSYAAVLGRSGRVGPLGPERAVETGLALVDSALRIDPSLAEAWTARAVLMRFQDPREFSGALDAHEKAVSLAPNDADAQHAFGETLLLLGSEARALDRFRRALAIDPSRAATLRSYSELEMLGRRYASSCALINASLAANEYDPLSYALRSQVRLRLGEFRDAFADAEIASRLAGERWGEALSVLVLAGGGDSERAKREAKRLATARLRGNAPLGVREARYLGAALVMTGDKDRAIAALAKARPNGAELRAALRDPMLDPIRTDPRFRRLVTGGGQARGIQDGVSRTPGR